MNLKTLKTISRVNFAASWPEIMFASVAVLFWLFGLGPESVLRYDRDAISAGEVWRLVTGNLIHLGAMHLALNLMGLGLIWALCGREFRPLFWLAVWGAGIFGVSLGLFAFNPELRWYVGLSGVLHGLLAAGALGLVAHRRFGGWTILSFLAAKLAWEQWQGPLPFTASTAGGPVIVDAHFYGAIAGAVTATAILFYEYWKNRP
ncbi:MAG: rhombosortase, partial [Gammaproteobacteria bacterium]|nr:rhombosortase [Gammaproteobacteria bacterium]